MPEPPPASRAPVSPNPPATESNCCTVAGLPRGWPMRRVKWFVPGGEPFDPIGLGPAENQSSTQGGLR